MRRLRYGVVSDFGAWAPNPAAINQIIDAVHETTSRDGSDTNQEKVKAELDRIASSEVQQKLRLSVRPLLSEFLQGRMTTQ